MQLKEMVRQQAAHDVDPPLSEAAAYIKNEMSKEGYRHLLAVGKSSHTCLRMDCRLWQVLRSILLLLNMTNSCHCMGIVCVVVPPATC